MGTLDREAFDRRSRPYLGEAGRAAPTIACFRRGTEHTQRVAPKLLEFRGF
jgi:hypothetical protein